MNFILAITTYNRLSFLKRCISSFLNTRGLNHQWTLIIADDDSKDGTMEYLDSLCISEVNTILIKNKRIGVHQQVNTILTKLQNLEWDFCFKIDDDIQFLKSGWDTLYYQTAIGSGNHHLVFHDEKWAQEQSLSDPIENSGLIGRSSLLNVHGFFYTISPSILENVGFFDLRNFGFRGMGHVDYTARCAKAGFTSIETPWDIINSNSYITAYNPEYKSAIDNTYTSAYDELYREEKELSILDESRIYVPLQKIDERIYLSFKRKVNFALIEKVKKQKQEIEWYHTENERIKSWYKSRYDKIPSWIISVLNKIF